MKDKNVQFSKDMLVKRARKQMAMKKCSQNLIVTVLVKKG
jgi:hypothetical protein